ncbi:hypothetical protein NMG60_11028229 [Bertholletia excelsa]
MTREMEREMGLESLVSLAIHLILSKLGPAGTASMGCVGKRFRALASDDSLWSKYCADELEMCSPEDPFGNPTPTYKSAYQIWRETFEMYPWQLVIRVKKCWSRLKSWLAVNFPEVLSTLRKGASEDQINELERCLKVKLPLPTRLLYRLCDGQDIREESHRNWHGSPLGLIGGYSFCNYLVNVYLLPLNRVIAKTKHMMTHLGYIDRFKYIVVATSSTCIKKTFFLNCTNGQLYVGSRNLTSDGRMIPCVPNELVTSKQNSGARWQQDALLLWLEEHGRRLHDGTIKLRGEEKAKSINLFPEEAPHCSTAVTNGVKVRASAVFVPEFSDPQHESLKYLFVYSIRMSLLPGGCSINGFAYDSCQLDSRHWILHANDAVIGDFHGKAVIGKFPLLCPGKEEFIYESYINLPDFGSMEGSFTFVPGRIKAYVKFATSKFPDNTIVRYPKIKILSNKLRKNVDVWHCGPSKPQLALCTSLWARPSDRNPDILTAGLGIAASEMSYKNFVWRHTYH